MPPYRAAPLTGSIVRGLSIGKIVTEIPPFVVASMCILLLITYVPVIVFWLPRMLVFLKNVIEPGVFGVWNGV